MKTNKPIYIVSAAFVLSFVLLSTYVVAVTGVYVVDDTRDCSSGRPKTIDDECTTDSPALMCGGTSSYTCGSNEGGTTCECKSDPYSDGTRTHCTWTPGNQANTHCHGEPA
jgi:hypothetical protein